MVLGDLNAHLPDQPEDFVTNRSAYPQHQHVHQRTPNEWAKTPNARGKCLLKLVNELDLLGYSKRP